MLYVGRLRQNDGYYTEGGEWVRAEDARKLERELVELRGMHKQMCAIAVERYREIERLSMSSERKEWIPVGERLPEQRIRVLGYDGLMIEDCFYGVSSNRGYADWSEVAWRRTSYEDHFRATHWMPLPEAPK